MLNIQPTYNSNQSAGSMPVVFHASEVKESKMSKVVASALVVASVGIVSLQTGFVLNASANGNPISSPISSAPVSSPTVNNPTSQPNGSNPSGGGNNGSYSSSCNNEAPKAPKIVSAVTTGKNEITLNWEKPVSGNVTHYSVSYGLVKGKPLYGVANVGNVTSFKVSGLSGGVTYYFYVKAVNDCTPSVASNEAAVKVGGKFINSPAVGFKAGVLGQTKVTPVNTNNKPAIAKPVFFNNVDVPVNTGFAGKVVSFFKGLFD